MKFGISWIGVILIVSFLVYFVIYGKNVYETFTTNTVNEGFVNSVEDIEITTCPADSKMFIDTKGFTMCCDSIIESDKCSGNTICTLSEGTTNIPTCTAWYKTYLEERGKLRCPASLPNYYEIKNGNSGCTSGNRNREGTSPLTTSQPYCTIYKDKVEDESDIDSCSNKILLDNAVCFATPGVTFTKQLMYNGRGNPVTVQCTYTDENSNKYTCTTDASMERLVSKNLPKGQTLAEWKAGSENWDFLYKLQFCSGLENYKIKKTIAPTEIQPSDDKKGAKLHKGYRCFPTFRIY